MTKTVYTIISVAGSDHVGIFAKMPMSFSEYKINIMHEQELSALHRKLRRPL